MPVQFKTESCADYAVLRISGEMELESDPELEQVLEDRVRHGGHFIVDLAEVPYIGSGAVGVFLGFQARLQGTGQAMALVRCQPWVEDFMGRLGMCEALGIFTRTSQAISYFRSSTVH